MRPLTNDLPKSLLPVAGRPFVEWQLEWLAANDVRDVVLSVGHRGTMISDFVADGTRWNVRVSYVFERDGLLGTGGALRLAADRGVLGPVSLVLYGDSYLPVKIQPVLDAFDERGAPGLMTVWCNDGRYERSNVQFEQGYVLRYDKRRQDPSMRFIDYGLSVVSTGAVASNIPKGRPSDLGDLFSELSIAHRLGGFEVHERFYEIGSARGLRELDEHLRRA